MAMFGASKDESMSGYDTIPAAVQSALLLYAPPHISEDLNFTADLGRALDGIPVECGDTSMVNERDFSRARAVLAIFQDAYTLSSILEQVNQQRNARDNGTPVLIIALHPKQLAEFGSWLHERAIADELAGIRLILTSDVDEILHEVKNKLEAVREMSVLPMPVSTDIENSAMKYFYCISPELRKLLATMKGLAENNIHRVYLLGGPGSGKTSLAYYYYLCRNRGKFVTVNLQAESTGEKSQMKSLLCGHVSGAFPGASAREGAFSMARDGVCFLDESHGVSGVVMEVLMEALDNGQYMPFGATTKRPVECAVIFASNRSWEHLRSNIALDEHARLGATLLGLSDLAKRREDLIAVLATTLAKMSTQCTTWTPPYGLTDEAWGVIRACPWRGNMRTLIRVMETAFVSCITKGDGTQLIDAEFIREGIDLWEPEEHHSHNIYTSI